MYFKKLGLNSFSRIARIERFDNVCWKFVLQQLEIYLRNLPLLITICRALTRCPTEDERQRLIHEKQTNASAIGGQRGDKDI